MADINPPVDTTIQAREATTKSQNVSAATTETAAITADPNRHAAKQNATFMSAAARSAAAMVTQTVDAAAATATGAVNVATETAHETVASATPLVDIYRDAARNSADHMHALFGSWITVSRGMQDLQLKWLETVTHSIETSGARPFEMWQVQRNLYASAIDTTFASATRMLETASRSLQTTVQPPETRH